MGVIKLFFTTAAALFLAGCRTTLPDGTKLSPMHEYTPGPPPKIQMSQNLVDGMVRFGESASDKVFSRTVTAAKELAPKE